MENNPQWMHSEMIRKYYISQREYLFLMLHCINVKKKYFLKLWLWLCTMYKDDINDISCGIEHHNKSTGEKHPLGCWKSRKASLFLMPAICHPCVSPVSGVTGGDGIIISLGIWVTVLPSHKRQHVWLLWTKIRRKYRFGFHFWAKNQETNGNKNAFNIWRGRPHSLVEL